MNNFHGIIFAYHNSPELRELGTNRTSSAMPFAGRYRLIDFALSNFMNAGIYNVGVILQKDYQSLIEHIGSGMSWDMAKRMGGLSILPPFAVPGHHMGIYEGSMEALSAVRGYIELIREDYIVLCPGDICSNVDYDDLCRKFLASGADIMAVCSSTYATEHHVRYIPDAQGFATEMITNHAGPGQGVAAIDTYVTSKKLLLELIDYCSEARRPHWHRDAVSHAMSMGKKIGIYLHEGYVARVDSVDSYYKTSMDMLNYDVSLQILRSERPVRTVASANVSSFYGPESKVVNSLVADGCYIEGQVENSIIFAGTHIAKGAVIKNSIIMNDCTISEGVCLTCVIADKEVSVSPMTTLVGNGRLPLVMPKNYIV